MDRRLKDYPWLNQVKNSPNHKIRVLKRGGKWYLFLPTDQPGKRTATMFNSAEAAFNTAMSLQDEINEPSE